MGHSADNLGCDRRHPELSQAKKSNDTMQYQQWHRKAGVRQLKSAAFGILGDYKTQSCFSPIRPLNTYSQALAHQTVSKYKLPSSLGTCRLRGAKAWLREVDGTDPLSYPGNSGCLSCNFNDGIYPLISKNSHPLNTSCYQETFLWNSLCCPYFCNAVTSSQAHCAPVGSTVLLCFKYHFAP